MWQTVPTSICSRCVPFRGFLSPSQPVSWHSTSCRQTIVSDGALRDLKGPAAGKRDSGLMPLCRPPVSCQKQNVWIKNKKKNKKTLTLRTCTNVQCLFVFHYPWSHIKLFRHHDWNLNRRTNWFWLKLFNAELSYPWSQIRLFRHHDWNLNLRTNWTGFG